MADSNKKGEASKLVEQATAKAELSYSYWAANEVKGAAPPPEAKRLTTAEAEQHAEELKLSKSGSLWNAAGTFEERDLSFWVKDAVKELFVGAEGQPAEGAVAFMTELVSCTGDANQWVVRGTPRANFDLDITFKWTVTVDGTEVSGTARVPNAAWDELDELSIEIAVENGKEREDCGRAAARALLPTIRSKLEELIEKIRSYGS